MRLRSFPPSAGHSRAAVLEAESTLVGQYGDLVRLAHVVLPASLGRHRRVLLAHSVVQRVLPATHPGRVVPGVPLPRREGRLEPAALRRSYLVTVVRDALALGRRPALWPARLAPPRTLLPRLPLVVGLRLFPGSGSPEELRFAQALSELPAPARAAFVLRLLPGTADESVADVLTAAGVADPIGALHAAQAFAAAHDTGAGFAAERGDPGTEAQGDGARGPQGFVPREFDACALRAGPTDLLRRRRRVRLGAVAALALLVVGAVLTDTPPDSASRRTALPSATTRSVLRAADLTRAPADLWDNTSRVDFTAWPARGSRIRDESLLGRALSTWTRPGPDTRLSATRGTPTVAPPDAPQLLYAGNVGGLAVVLFHDGRRLARYTEPLSADGPRSLTVARADDADVTTAAAVTVTSDSAGVRYLIAPWVAETETRDLLRPDVLGRPLGVSREGITQPVRPLPAPDGCTSVPVLQLRSSERIAEHHAFLLAGLDGLSPVHLTYTPLPGRGAPSREPREATGPAALSAWSHQACSLGALRGGSVSAVHAWDFAEQDLPDGGGHAVWTCARTSTWRGPGDVTVTLRGSADRPGAPARTVSRERSTAVCGRFGRHVVAATGWRSPKNRWYVLAAGSRAVTALTIGGSVSAREPGRTLAVPAPPHPRVTVAATLSTGADLPGVAPAPR
ncbi:hypothetical protein [Streptomyces sp. 351MFTsu5.1]|uniref:hypothetical protein n=1 Tax=Streptomyces sp. 351MFTsu5.1 TaxID=1172180 RepID=UPI000381A698|nr:hypothetical protein [Streptomyces sp. 351MFTsu5.1]